MLLLEPFDRGLEYLRLGLSPADYIEMAPVFHRVKRHIVSAGRVGGFYYPYRPVGKHVGARKREYGDF